MEEDVLERLLQNLTTEEVPSYRIEETIDQIIKLFHSDLSSVEAYVYTAQTLDTKTGIPRYIQLAAVNKVKSRGDPPLKKAFDLLDFVIVNFPTAAEVLSQKVIEWCSRFLNLEVSNDSKSNVIRLGKSIVYNCPCITVDWESLILRLKTYVTTQHKIPPTFVESLFSFLGAICELHPEIFDTHKNWVFNQLSRAFERFHNDKNISDVLVEAGFNGLLGTLVNFPPLEYEQLFYRNLKEFSKVRRDGLRNTVTRAALRVFCKHAHYFAHLIYNDLEHWHKNLKEWIGSEQSSEHKQLGITSLEMFYSVIRSHVISTNPDNTVYTFTYLKNYLSRSLDGSSIFAMKDVYYGVSELAPLYLKYSAEDELLKTMESVATLVDNNPGLVGMQLEATSKIYLVLSKRPDWSLLARLAVSVIESFNSVEPYFQQHCLRALENSLSSWLKCGEMDVHLEPVIYQSLLRSCAHPIIADVELLEEKEKLVSYKNFMPVWVQLLTISSRGSDPFKNTVGKIVFDAFMVSFLKIISKLDLSLRVLSVEHSDPALAMEAHSPSDFQIFVNLVDLFQDVIPVADSCHFWKWLPDIFTQCVELGQHAPMVSGFYKVIATCFRVLLVQDATYDGLEELLCNFLEVSMRRVDSQKGDLLIANLRMNLLAPMSLISRLSHLLAPLVVTAARSGRGYPELLELCISALDRWLGQLRDDQIHPIIEEVLPHLALVLLSPVNEHKIQPSTDQKSLKSRGKIRKKVIGSSDKKLLVLQKQFLLFLAKLEPRLCMKALDLRNENRVFEGSELHYKLPLPDAKLSVALSSLLPRVMELALASADRSTRVTSCELLHSIVLLAVARTRVPDSNPELMRRLIQTSLTLGCDTDSVVRDLFSPLVIQMTHYFSSLIQGKSKESAVMIKILIENVTQTQDSGLRDFAARCLREFVEWSIRQTDPTVLSINPYNVQAVLRILCDYTVHPDRCKRVGAAVAFNNLYTVVREDKDILNIYWLRLYHYFLRSLEMCSYEEDASLVTSAIQHLHRPFLEKRALFESCPIERKIPPGFSGGTWIDVALATLKHCQSPNAFLRKLCQSFVKKLLSPISVGAFMQQQNIVVKFDCDAFGYQQDKCAAAMDYAMWLLEVDALDSDDLKPLCVAAEKLLDVYANSPSCKHLVTLLSFLTKTADSLLETSVANVASIVLNGGLNDSVIRLAMARLIATLRTQSIHWQVFWSRMPALDERNILERLTYAGKSKFEVNFFRYFLLIDASGSLSDDDYCGDRIVMPLFEILFKTKGHKVITVQFDQPVKESLINLLKFAIKKGLSSQIVMELFTDTTIVENNGRNTTKGKFFFSFYKSELLSMLVEDHMTSFLLRKLGDTAFEWAFSLFEHLREGLVSHLKPLKTVLFIMRILDDWNSWTVVVPQRNHLLDLLKVMAHVKGDSCGFFKDIPNVRRWFFDTASEPDLSYQDNVAMSFFSLLPQFLSFEEESNSHLPKALALFERKWLRSGRGDIAERKPANSMRKAALESLLLCVKITGSLDVLKFTIESLAQNPTVLKENVLKDIMKEIACKFSDAHVLKVSDVFCNLILIDLVDYKGSIFATTLLLQILVSAPKQVSIKFFESRIMQLLEILQGKLSDRRERDLVKKIAATHLVRALYSTTSQSDRSEMQMRLVRENENYQDVFKKIIQCCGFQPLRKGEVTGDEAELLRLLNCARANFLCVFATIFTADRNFVVFLFRDEFWKSVIDTSKKYNFAMDFAQIPKRKQVETAIKITANDQSDETVRPTVAYADSHSSALFESTLSEDVRNFDLTHATVTPKSSSLKEVKKSSNVFELEMDPLNQHEIVPDLCALIRLMITRNLTIWLRFLLETLTTSSCKNTKLLVLKIIFDLDQEGLMETNHYQSQCAPVILDSVVSLFQDTPANYFTVDLINMLILWRADLAGQSNSLMCVVKGLITQPGSQRKDVLKYLLDVVRSVIEMWKYLLDSEELTEVVLSRTVRNSEIDNYVTLHFASILLANQLIVLSAVNVDRLVMWLLSAMEHAKNCSLAAETCGMALNSFRNHLGFKDVYDKVCKFIDRYRGDGKTISGVTILYYVHKFYPEISDAFVPMLVTRACRERSAIREQSLKLLLSHVENHPGQHDEELSTCFKQLADIVLKSNMALAQEVMLQIILHMVDALEDATLEEIIPEVVRLSEDSSEKLRDVACQVLMGIYKHFEHKPPVEKVENVLMNCKIALLGRMNDDVGSVREKCVRFWSQMKARHSVQNRLLFILTELYTPQTETEMIEYACRVLLEATETTPDYKLDIFDHPLMDCSYSEMQLLVSWRAQHATLAPMFAPSVATELGRIDLNLPASSTVNLRLRETARSLLFSPTISTDVPLSFSAQGQSSIVETAFRKPRPKRFYANAAATKVYFAKRAAAIAGEEQSSVQERIKERDAGVTVYRNYRMGDFPDIQIKHEQFIALLKTLIGKDSQFSQALFVGLFSAIAELNNGSSFQEQIMVCFNNLLKQSKATDLVAIGAVFEVALSKNMTLDSQEVCRVARSSGLVSAGALLIERSISDISHDGPSSAKRSRIEHTSEWLMLAQLLHEMRDARAVRGVFLDKLCVKGPARKAIINETLMEWSFAAENYEKVLLAGTEAPDFQHFYCQSYFACLANLSDWSKLLESSEQSLKNDKEMWENRWCTEVLLPWNMRARMVVSFSPESTTLQDYLFECLQNPLWSDILTKFTDELAVAHWLKKDSAKTMWFAYQSLIAFFNVWSNADEWDLQLKKKQLIKLVVLSEIQRIVTVLTSPSTSTSLAEMIRDTAKEMPSELCDLVSWDVKLRLRDKFYSFLRDDLCANENQLDELKNNLRKAQLAMAQAYIGLGNVDSAKKFLMAGKVELNHELYPRWRYLRNQLAITQIKKSQEIPQEKLLKFAVLCKKVEEDANALMDTGDNRQGLLNEMNRGTLAIIGEMVAECQKGKINPDAVPFSEKGDLKEFWLKIAEDTANGLTAVADRGLIYVQMSKFCRQHIPEREVSAIKYLLKAMQCDNCEARQLIGGVFTISNVKDDRELEIECTRVPTWMFLTWRHQLVSHLIGNPLKMVRDILLRIARDYPTALSYGLRISMENFSDELKKTRFVQELASLVFSDTLQESFVTAVGKVANPLLIMKHYLEQIEFHGSREKEMETMERLKMLTTEPSDNYQPLQAFRSDVDNITTSHDAHALKLAVQEMYHRVKSSYNSFRLSRKVQHFSSWLSEFHDTEGRLEVPGQYDGMSEPQVDRHVRVVSFKADVVIMPSKRQPIKLTMIGNDAREYSFLVKFGEDLRQDERVQQILGQMRRTLQVCEATDELELDCYSVIPLTASWGLIQWVDSAKTLKQFINVPVDQVDAAAQKHLRFLGKSNNLPEIYRQGYLERVKDAGVAFELQAASFDREALRKGLWGLCASPQQFFQLRTNFATSMAVMSIAHWLIGIGDRHLDNTLVSTRTGRAVGIDFGYAFGFATHLSPPELIPFRLTPQILQVFSPLKESGWLKQTMVDSLRALRKDPSVLLAMLEVFVQEPCLDWVQQAKRLAKEQGGDLVRPSDTYQQTKIQAVRRKLVGENPLRVIEMDLRTGRVEDALLERQIEVLRGVHRDRALSSNSELSPEQQVNCLIDLATDPLVLSFTYVGWAPWL